MTLLPRSGSATAVVLVIAVFFFASSSRAADRFEGALWKFELKRVANNSDTLSGHFRVADQVMYQKQSVDDDELAKQVGTTQVKDKKTRFQVEDFRVFKPRSKDHVLIKGSGLVTLQEFGRWRGLFTDGRGRNWRMTAWRVRE